MAQALQYLKAAVVLRQPEAVESVLAITVRYCLCSSLHVERFRSKYTTLATRVIYSDETGREKS